MATAVSDAAMNGLNVKTPKVIQRYVPDAKVQGGTLRENLKEPITRND